MRRRGLLISLAAASLAGGCSGERPSHAPSGRPGIRRQAAFPRAVLSAGVNVRHDPYRAIGDGVADDTGAFASARDAAGPSGVVAVPAGTYLLNNLELDVPGQTWCLMSGATLLLKPATSNPLVTVSANGVTIEGPGTMDGNLAHQRGSQGGGTILITGNRVTLRNLLIQNCNGYGVLFGNADQGTVTGCVLRNTWQEAIEYQSTGDYMGPVITGNRISNYERGTESISGGIGVTTNGSGYVTDVVIAENEIEVYPLYWGQLSDVNSCIAVFYGNGFVISGNTLRGSCLAVTLPHSIDGAISCNHIAGYAFNAIEITNVSSLAVSGNSIIDTNPRGASHNAAIPILEVCREVTVTGNSITQITPEASTFLAASGSAPDVHNVVISGNTVGKSGAGTVVECGPKTTNLTIRGNIFDCGGTDCTGIYLSTDATTRQGVVIADNQISNYGAGAGIVYGARGTRGAIDYVTVQGNVFRAGAQGIVQGGESSWGPHKSVVSNVGP
jgi:hypothetical protein